MDQNAHCDLMAARLANQKPHLLALAQKGHPQAFDQAWNLLDPIFVDAERHGLGSRCYQMIGLLLAALARPPPTRQTRQKGRLNFLYPRLRVHSVEA